MWVRFPPGPPAYLRVSAQKPKFLQRVSVYRHFERVGGAAEQPPCPAPDSRILNTESGPRGLVAALTAASPGRVLFRCCSIGNVSTVRSPAMVAPCRIRQPQHRSGASRP